VSWQPQSILYPDAEQVLCDATRALLNDQGALYIGRTVPDQITTAVVWNRIGGADPLALMQARIYATTDARAWELGRILAARLPHAVDGKPIRSLEQTGFADLGNEQQPMRQLLVDITLRGSQQ
jgi:hypothetical protein